MPKRRDQIRMTDDELWSFIESQKTVQLATIGKDGTPHVVPLWFGIEDGAIVLETFTKSQKVKNLERDARATLLFEDGEVYNELRGASITGKVELVRDLDRVHDLHMLVLRRNTPEVPEEALEAAVRGMVKKKTALLLRPAECRIASWDHRKLDVAY